MNDPEIDHAAKKQLAAAAIGLVGFIVICLAANLGVAIGVTFCIWANNVERSK